MIALTAEEAAEALGLRGFPGPVQTISIDSRRLRPGDWFIALEGERFDGHAFVGDALRSGAAGALISASRTDEWGAADGGPGAGDLPSRSRVVTVPDTLGALRALARAVRRKSTAAVIGITGSVGKTTTKDFVTAMARRVGPTVATEGNQNNEIGVPLTLLSIEADTRVVVVEMGMRGRGQIAELVDVAEPDVGVITNIYPVHLELLGSLEAIAEAKAEVVVGLRPACAAVVPADTALLEPVLPRVRCRVLHFALGPGREEAEVWGAVTDPTSGEGTHLRVRWPGAQAEVEVAFRSRHRLENLMAAIAACAGAGLPVEACLAGIGDVEFTPGRGDVLRAGDWVVINDTYNANPAAVKAALDDLVDLAEQRAGRPVAVLGDMLELGPEAALFHEQCGAYAAEVGVQVLWGVGDLSRSTASGFRQTAQAGQQAGHVETVEDVSPILAGLRPADVVLFKASRSVGLEAMVSAVLGAAGVGEGDTAPPSRGERL